MAKFAGIEMGEYIQSVSDRKAMRWCINNGVYISPKAVSSVKWVIDIEINGKTDTSPEFYGKNDIWKQIFKFYKYYYEKYEKNI